jgi:hypothetical protein
VPILVVVGDEPAKDKKPTAETTSAKEMVDAIVNRNQAPKLVDWPAFPNLKAALFPENYDWKEENRVRAALTALSRDMRVDVWEELVRRANDQAYCVIQTDEQVGGASLKTVGDVCRTLAYRRLIYVFSKHVRSSEGRPIWLNVGVESTSLAEWRKARSKKSLHELQIEVCEAALRAPSKKKGQTAIPYLQNHKEAREKIEAALENLRKTKEPDLRDASGRFVPGGESLRYNPETAKRVRDCVKSGKYESLPSLGLAPK